MHIKTFTPKEAWPELVIYPHQTHSANIREIVTGQEDLADTDGVWTDISNNFILAVNTADCAPIAFYNDTRYGIVHAGWRGACNGIVESMLEIIPNGEIWVGPILPSFEIQKDFCYEMIYEKFGDQYFEDIDENITFHFQKALASILPSHAKWDDRSTFETPELGSWRRDKFLEGNRNLTAIWH